MEYAVAEVAGFYAFHANGTSNIQHPTNTSHDPRIEGEAGSERSPRPIAHVGIACVRSVGTRGATEFEGYGWGLPKDARRRSLIT